MHFLLILTSSALIVFSQAAPQLTNFNPGNFKLKDIINQALNPGNNLYQNQNYNGPTPSRGFQFQPMFAGYHRPNNNGRQRQQNNQGYPDRCWYPNNQNQMNFPQQYPSQFLNGNYPAQNNYNMRMWPQNYHGNYWDGYRPPHGPPHYHRPGDPPHYYGHGRPPPPPPPRRPPHRPHNGNSYNLELCEENSNDNGATQSTGTSSVPETISTSFDDYPVSTSAPLINSSVNPESETVTQGATNSPVQTTTEFDWNNYFVEASPDNPGGAGAIDIRGGGIDAS